MLEGPRPCTIFCLALIQYAWIIILYWLVPQFGVNNYCVLGRVKAKKRNNNIQQRTEFHNHSPLLTMVGTNKFIMDFVSRFNICTLSICVCVWVRCKTFNYKSKIKLFCCLILCSIDSNTNETYCIHFYKKSVQSQLVRVDVTFQWLWSILWFICIYRQLDVMIYIIATLSSMRNLTWKWSSVTHISCV